MSKGAAMRYRIPSYVYLAFSSLILTLDAIIAHSVIPLWIGGGNAALLVLITETYARTMRKMDREDGH